MNDVIDSSVEIADCHTCTSNITDLVQRLHCVLLGGNTGKHTPYIMARKEIVFPVLNELMTVVSSLPKDMPKSCAECSLWRKDKDIRVALATTDRLMSGDSSVTRDEAVNLHKLIWQAYNNGV